MTTPIHGDRKMMKLRAKLGAYSSIVGQSVLLQEAKSERMVGQVMIIGLADELRTKEAQEELLTTIRDAINNQHGGKRR